MTLEELARAAPFAEPLAVPPWTLGCFHRRCITYANGQEDASTQVIWIQSHGLTGDIRVPAWRPGADGKSSLAEFSAEALPLLASVEGGVADTAWSDDLMHWNNWSAFQPYDKWPEPGVLQRVGACLIEWAPSGVYVEDWRLQPGCSGLMAGLRLISETVGDGAERARGGGLIVNGEHALLTLDRREPLPGDGPVAAQIAADPSLLEAVFDAETSYARGGVIELSTNPFRHGEPLAFGDFEPAAPGHLSEALPDGTRRLWRIDTLLPDVDLPLSTPASDAGAAWLERERGVLLRG